MRQQFVAHELEGDKVDLEKMNGDDWLRFHVYLKGAEVGEALKKVR